MLAFQSYRHKGVPLTTVAERQSLVSGTKAGTFALKQGVLAEGDAAIALVVLSLHLQLRQGRLGITLRHGTRVVVKVFGVGFASIRLDCIIPLAGAQRVGRLGAQGLRLLGTVELTATTQKP